MTTVGFIGSGRIGGTLARLSVAAGHQVVLSNSRGPDTLAVLAAELGPRARAATTAEAAAGDLVVVSIPLRAYPGVPAGLLAGTVVVDTCNYYPQRDGQIAELDGGSVTSSELIQRHLPDSAVVKAFNNIFFKHLESLSRAPGSPTGPPCRSRVTTRTPRRRYPVPQLDRLRHGGRRPLAEGWRMSRARPLTALPTARSRIRRGRRPAPP